MFGQASSNLRFTDFFQGQKIYVRSRSTHIVWCVLVRQANANRLIGGIGGLSLPQIHNNYYNKSPLSHYYLLLAMTSFVLLSIIR